MRSIGKKARKKKRSPNGGRFFCPRLNPALSGVRHGFEFALFAIRAGVALT